MNAVELGFAAGWRLVRALPEPVAAAGFRITADRLTRRRGPGVQRLAGNLRQVVGPSMPQAELDRLVRDAMRSYLRYYMEAFRLPGRSRVQHLDGFALERGELLGAAVTSGTGAVVAVPHSGNWDAAGAWVAANGWPIATVAERLRPEGLYRRFLAYREQLGMEILPTHGGNRPPLEVLGEKLKKGYIVPLLADRDLSRRGVEVRFFGGRTRMPAGPAMLALRTGAPLYVLEMWYDRDRVQAYLAGPLELPPPDSRPMDQRVAVITQMIADRLAVGIARHPADWHMLQRLWLPDDR